jgi:hypothetical protein
MGLSVLKRKGRMTEEQKLKRNEMEQANPTDPKQTATSVYNLLQDIILSFRQTAKNGPSRSKRKLLITDEHKSYPKSLAKADPDKQYFDHLRVSSRAYRNCANLLFPVNYVDRQLRKDQANHTRESVQFARCPQAMMTRLTIYQVYHNCMSPYRIKKYRKGDVRTRVERMGLSRERLGQLFLEVWGKRVFRGKVQLWREELKTWDMKWRNPGIDMGGYVPRYIMV